MRPDIYPRTLENIKAVLLYYFPNESHTSINKYAKKVYDSRELPLNELEWLCETIVNNKDLLDELYPKGADMSSLIGNFNEALLNDESTWRRSAVGMKNLRKIKDQLS